MKQSLVFACLWVSTFLLLISNCARTKKSITDKSADSTASVASVETSPINWADSISADLLSKTTADKNGVKVLSGGNYFDIIYFYRNDKIIAVDPIRNGNFLGVRGGKGQYEKIWTGTDWKDCRLYPCTGMDIWTVEIEGGVTYVSVRHGSVRDLVYCYAVMPSDTIYRSPRWRDFGDHELENGVAVSRNGNQYKIEGRPWSEGNHGRPTSNSHYGLITFHSKSRVYVLNASDERHWVDEPSKKTTIIEPLTKQ